MKLPEVLSILKESGRLISVIGIPDTTSVLKFNKIVLDGDGGYIEVITGETVPSECNLVIWHSGEWLKESLIVSKDKIEYIHLSEY